MEYSEFAQNEDSDMWIRNYVIEKEYSILEVLIDLLMQRPLGKI